jgi:branched-chain amino acid transport system ATP-binding protein
LPEPLLRLEGVKTDIAQYHILHGVDLDVPQGQVTMLLGRNGAGKTTTLRSVMGLWKPHAGRVMLAGRNIAGLDPASIAQAGVALVPEDMGIFANLTVEENMILAAVSGRPDQKRLEWLFSVFPPLKTFWKNPAGNLSGGQKQMLSTARAMVEDRKLYLIDEPSKGLAPAIVSTLARALRDLKAGGATILMVEQNFKLARALGDHAAVMDDGRIVWAGPMATLAGDSALQERLMGLSLEGHA